MTTVQIGSQLQQDELVKAFGGFLRNSSMNLNIDLNNQNTAKTVQTGIIVAGVTFLCNKAINTYSHSCSGAIAAM